MTHDGSFWITTGPCHPETSSKIRLWEQQAEDCATNTFVNYTFSPFCLIFSLSSFPVFYLSFIFIPTQASHVNENYATWQRFDQVLNRQSASPADGENRIQPRVTCSSSLLDGLTLLSPLAPRWAWNRAGPYGTFPPILCLPLVCGKCQSKNKFNQRNEKTQKERRIVKGDQRVIM